MPLYRDIASPSHKMAVDVASVVRKRYTVNTVPQDFLASVEEGKQQILWIGCSSSWITETDGLGAERESFFVHRNLANVVSNADLSSASALEYCIGILKVKHIVVCGHYDCSLVVSGGGPGALNRWCSDFSKLHKANEDHLRDSGTSMTETDKHRHLVEVHALAESDWVKQQPLVAKGIQDGVLEVHAFVFDKRRRSCVTLTEGI